MDRRSFLTGLGTLGAATAGGWAALEGDARNARAEGLARAAGVKSARSRSKAAAAKPEGLFVGWLPGSGALLDYAAHGQPLPYLSTHMTWASWTPAQSIHVLERRVDLAFGALRPSEVAPPSALRSLDVVAHYAIEGAPSFVPFRAFSYRVAEGGKRARTSSPVMFEAATPNRVGLQVDYRLDESRVLPGMAASGMVYLPIAASDGLGTGVYVLATPSRVTGAAPDFAEYNFTGDLVQPLRRTAGGRVDFDFMTLTIAPVVA